MSALNVSNNLITLVKNRHKFDIKEHAGCDVFVFFNDTYVI